MWPSPCRCGESASRIHAAKIDPRALGETIQRPSIDPEELGGELLVPLGLLQDTTDVASNPFAKACRDFSGVMTGAGSLLKFRRQVLGEEDRVGRRGIGLLDDML